MEKDDEKVSHWFDLAKGEVIEGLVIGEGEQQKVYVITTKPPEGLECVHDRWPLISASHTP